ncbi:hypothetical protein [Novosphingobium sp. PhB165]|nr:hypothetical protein [Novosphingobium sp. PhB165]
MKHARLYSGRHPGRREKRARFLKSEDRLLIASLIGLAAALAIGLTG